MYIILNWRGGEDNIQGGEKIPPLKKPWIYKMWALDAMIIKPKVPAKDGLQVKTFFYKECIIVHLKEPVMDTKRSFLSFNIITIDRTALV